LHDNAPFLTCRSDFHPPGGVRGPVPNIIDEGLVFDVGAHVGEDSDFYLELGYRVVAVEANPDLAERLAKRFEQEIQRGRYIIVPKAIGEADEHIAFFVNKRRSIWGTTDPEWAARNEHVGCPSEQIRVPCIRFEELLRLHGHPLYVKTDIEGADMCCVRALEHVDPAARPKFISVESNKTSWRELREEFDAFERLGYDRYQVVDQRGHPSGRYRTLDRGVIDYTFESGASGPFGTDLPGPWLTRRQALRRYIPIFVLYRTIGDTTFMAKVLRRIPVLRRCLGWVGWYDTHAMRA